MKNIKTLKVGAHDFKIRTLTPAQEEELECEGYTSTTAMEIGVSDKYSTTRQAEILIHEIAHALCWDAGVAWNDAKAERVIRNLSPRVAALFRDNPKQLQALIDAFAAG